MLPAFFGSDGSFPLQFAIIFVVIFAVLAVLVLLIRRFTGRGLSFPNSASRQRQPRLGIVDVYELDRQRQLILLRRDNVEHLLLVGGPNDVVVERNISRSAGVLLPADDTARDVVTPEAVPDLAPPSREPTFSAREPTPPPRMAAGPEFSVERRGGGEASTPEGAPAEPAFAMPLVVPPPMPDPQPRMERADEIVEVPPPSRREPQPARILRRTPPPLINPKPDVASERSRAPEPQAPITMPAAEPDFEAAFAAALAVPVAAKVPAPPVVTPNPQPELTRKADAGVLSDMARQLEEALRRPASAVTLSPAAIPTVELARDPAPPVAEADPMVETLTLPPPEPAVPEPAEEKMVTVPNEPAEAEDRTDPMAAGMASAADAPPDTDDLFEEPAPPIESEPRLTPEQKPAAAPEPPKPEPPKHEPALASTNPFSVEEIEAEFARLLGRPLDRKT